jgi:F0F1-type ATP synthase membrane subunit b/b'
MTSNKIKSHIIVDNNAVSKQTISMSKEVIKYETERAKSTLDKAVENHFIRV